MGMYLEGTFNVEPIWIHPWEKATVMVDEEYDVRRTASLSARVSWVNFSGDSLNNEVDNALNLYVNAIPDNKLTTSVKLLANVTEVQQYTLRFSNLKSFANSAYSCFSMEHIETGTVLDLNTDSIYVFDVDSVGQHHFILHFSPDLSKQLEVNEIICYGEDNGVVVFDAPYVMTNETFYKDGAFVKQCQGAPFTVENLSSGVYSIVSDSVLLSCSSNSWEYSFEEPEELAGNIGVENTEFMVGDPLVLTVEGSNGDVFTWVVNDTSYAGVTAAHILSDTLNYIILFVENASKICLLERDTVIRAEEKSTIGVLEQTKQLSFAYEIVRGKLLLYDVNNAMKLEYFSVAGKLLQVERAGSGKLVKLPLLKGATIMKLSSEETLENELTVKVFLK
jgi:hypothetical protein